jgi:cellulose synthase/poly-beta-1,6-N-acetylglucosamine synthase-like glycosyltransferase
VIKFSVVIPNLNSPTIDQTIESLENQCFDRDQYEVIVVGMDQPKLVQVSDYVRFDATERPLYPSAARNRGVAQAQGEILAFIDADCIANPDWLSVLAGRFEDLNVSILGGGIAFEHENYWTLSDNISLFHDYLSSLRPGQRTQLPTLNLAIRRSAFLQAEGFDERRSIAEDSDLTIRLRRQGYALYFEPRAVIRHRPSRSRFSDLISHHYNHGKYSIKVDPGYQDEKGLPGILRTRWGVLLGSPFLAAGVTARIFASDRALWTYWYTVPAVLSAKLAWCLGAAARPQTLRKMKIS